ncbi:MAG: hypothetical protein RL745_991 [Actinomycetota bacterium]|jgi:hypothetical protein
MQFDFATILQFLLPFLPFILPMFPGLSNILKIIPKPVWLAVLKAVDPGVVVTWSTPVAAQRANLEARRAALLGKAYSGAASSEDQAALSAVESQLAALPAGGILDWIKQNPMILLIIGGAILFFVTQKGGCQKPVDPPAKVSLR